MSLAQSFAKFGVKLKNSRQSWSGLSEDGKTVVLTLWRPGFMGQPLRYESKARPGHNADWLERWGNRERLENLLWAKERCGGRFHVVVIVPKDEDADKWEIGDSWPIDTEMRLTWLDPETGEFTAEAA